MEVVVAEKRAGVGEYEDDEWAGLDRAVLLFCRGNFRDDVAIIRIASLQLPGFPSGPTERLETP